MSSGLTKDMQIRIVRVREEVEVEDEIAPFETEWVGDPNLPIDTLLEHEGAEGITRRRFRVLYRDGEMVDRSLEDVWVAQEPSNKRIVYGQKDSTADFCHRRWTGDYLLAQDQNAGQPVTVRPLAGVSPSVPWYGFTRTGDRMRKGVVAVDPRIIPLRTQVYVPGYGLGDALDTGGNIQFRRIDLGYDDHNLVFVEPLG